MFVAYNCELSHSILSHEKATSRACLYPAPLVFGPHLVILRAESWLFILKSLQVVLEGTIWDVEN